MAVSYRVREFRDICCAMPSYVAIMLLWVFYSLRKHFSCLWRSLENFICSIINWSWPVHRRIAICCIRSKSCCVKDGYNKSFLVYELMFLTMLICSLLSVTYKIRISCAIWRWFMPCNSAICQHIVSKSIMRKQLGL